ncbi:MULTISPECIES: hypothetical protein [Clostridium]|uniref:Phage protein n=1 Tax=Clostridium disporicum TaxID=84024 RepID=A0A174F4Z1_9CLOT|nr:MULTISPECIES: hypothetical protein [Clostridium]CUO43390.1 Uncharacterised protein [Clostridium disporicum]
MANIAAVRVLIEMIRKIAFLLNDEEIRDIALVVNRALDRLEKENKDNE